MTTPACSPPPDTSGTRAKRLPIPSTRVCQPRACAKRTSQSRVCLSSGVAAWRSTPPASVAPIVATSWKSARNASSGVVVTAVLLAAGVALASWSDEALARWSDAVLRRSDEVLRRAALEVLSVALPAQVRIAMHDHLAAAQHGVDLPVDLEALPGRVVEGHVGGVGTDRRPAVRIVDDDVPVGAGLDDALASVQAEHAGGGGGGDLDEPLQADLLVDDAPVQEIEAVLDRAEPAGDLREAVRAELLLILPAERALVRRHHLALILP